MVLKVTPSSTPRMFTTALPLSKVMVIRVALISLTLFVTALLMIRISMKGRIRPNRPVIIEECVYDPRLIDVLGGEQQFNQIPILEVQEKNLVYFNVNLNPELKIPPHKMTQTFMKGKDTLGRLFFAFKYREKKTNEIKVDIFLCRDPKQNRWYYNDEKGKVNWTMTLFFLQKLVEKKHLYYELV
ncbi:MAG: hypothetical protein ACRDFB_06840 [Rhabdochlamydiaceae bacterium]